MKDTDISYINKKKEVKFAMNKFLSLRYFDIIYIIGLICFLILFYFDIKIKILTNFIVIFSIILLIIRLIYWCFFQKREKSINEANNIKNFLSRLAICVLTYISPVYCILQAPNLVVSKFILLTTFIIVIISAIIVLIMEKKINF